MRDIERALAAANEDGHTRRREAWSALRLVALALTALGLATVLLRR